VHLLPTGHGQSGRVGDAPEMVRARRSVIQRGHLDPLVAAIRARVAEMGRIRTVLDVGCGEGTLVGSVALAAGAQGYGMDLSKAALRIAARAHPEVTFFVGDLTHRLGVASVSVDLLLNVFAPRNPSEFSRILSTEGTLLLVIPAADHLVELRGRIRLLRIDEEKEERTVDRLASHLVGVAAESLRYTRFLPPEELATLVAMTPSSRHLAPSEIAELEGGEGLAVTFSMRILTFRRRG